jgi:hypothetical protein
VLVILLAGGDKSTQAKDIRSAQDLARNDKEDVGLPQCMMETKTAPYDVAEFLETPEEMAAYLGACIQESDGDAAFIAKALGDIARAKVSN